MLASSPCGFQSQSQGFHDACQNPAQFWFPSSTNGTCLASLKVQPENTLPKPDYQDIVCFHGHHTSHGEAWWVKASSDLTADSSSLATPALLFNDYVYANRIGLAPLAKNVDRGRDVISCPPMGHGHIVVYHTEHQPASLVVL